MARYVNASCGRFMASACLRTASLVHRLVAKESAMLPQKESKDEGAFVASVRETVADSSGQKREGEADAVVTADVVKQSMPLGCVMPLDAVGADAVPSRCRNLIIFYSSMSGQGEVLFALKALHCLTPQHRAMACDVSCSATAESKMWLPKGFTALPDIYHADPASRLGAGTFGLVIAGADRRTSGNQVYRNTH